MGFFRSIFRLIRSMFGLAEGGTDRATNSLLTSSPDAIRNQFQKTRNDWTKNYNSLKEAIAELQVLLNASLADLASHQDAIERLDNLMLGAIEQYKRTQDESLKIDYANFASQKESKIQLAEECKAKIDRDQKLIDTYTSNLEELRINIEKLKEEEARTVADITASKRIQAINEKLQGLSTDSSSRNLDVIREEAKKVKAMTQIDSKVSGADALKSEKKLLDAAKSSKYLSEFNKATAIDALFVEEKPKELVSGKQADHHLDQLFK